MDNNQILILLVDDDPLITRMYQLYLSREGFRVKEVPNGADAIIEAKKEKPNIVFLDIMMPKMNGVETLKSFKNDSILKDIPIIMLTNLGDKKDDIENAKSLGAADYLVKSDIRLQDLSERVKSILNTQP